jgi:hypothetical protein
MVFRIQGELELKVGASRRRRFAGWSERTQQDSGQHLFAEFDGLNGVAGKHVRMHVAGIQVAEPVGGDQCRGKWDQPPRTPAVVGDVPAFPNG